MIKLLRSISFGILGLVAFAGVALGQQGAFPNYPIVGGAAYCSSTTNGVCTNTVPAGPSVLTGNEQIPANTELANGRSPQNVLVTPSSLNANPINWVSAPSSFSISANNKQGGVFFISGSTISVANVTLPFSAIDGQQFVLSANRTILALSVTAPAGDTMGASSSPTVLTATTTASFGYRWAYHGTTKVWQRLQ